LILKGEGGTGAYTVYVDNFQVVSTTPALDSNETNGIVEITVKSGSTISFTASAVDTDPLTFGLETGAPAGAAITSGGAFSWTPSTSQVGLAHDIGVFVQDAPSGSVSKRDSEQFVVNVIADAVAPQAEAPGTLVQANATSVISFGAVPGQAYDVQVKGADGAWHTVGELTAESDTESVEITAGDEAGFYRIVEAGGLASAE
jgi:hypothetical protein